MAHGAWYNVLALVASVLAQTAPLAVRAQEHLADQVHHPSPEPGMKGGRSEHGLSSTTTGSDSYPTVERCDFGDGSFSRVYPVRPVVHALADVGSLLTEHGTERHGLEVGTTFHTPPREGGPSFLVMGGMHERVLAVRITDVVGSLVPSVGIGQRAAGLWPLSRATVDGPLLVTVLDPVSGYRWFLPVVR